MKELVTLAGAAKVSMDAGFSRLGRSLKASDAAACVLMTLAARVIAVGNALVVLAGNHQQNEGLPLLRSIFEMSLRMRVVALRPQEAEGFLKEISSSSWETLWRDDRFSGWMGRFGLPESEQRRLLSLCSEHCRANAAGLPWGHVFSEVHGTGISEEELLRLTALALGLALKALEERWPGEFEGADKILSQTLTRPSA